jgi:hypothetical protein
MHRTKQCLQTQSVGATPVQATYVGKIRSLNVRLSRLIPMIAPPLLASTHTPLPPLLRTCV